MSPVRKYRNKPTEVDGFLFASKKEAARFCDLRILQKAGHIRDLKIQPRFPLIVDGKTVAHYLADFAYLVPSGKTVIEDVKSPITRKNPTYRLKVKIMAAMGFDVVEV